MKQTAYKWLVTIFFILMVVSSIKAQDSLMNYLKIAAENNPTVKQRYYEFQAAMERIAPAGSLPDPEFTAGVFLTPMELVMGNQVADLSLMQMFPWFGVLKNAKDEMSFMAKVSFESMRDAKLQVFYDVQRTWFDMYRLQKDVQVTEKNIRILQMIERLSLSRYKSGSLGNTSGQGSGSTNIGGVSTSGTTGRYGSGTSVPGSGGQSGMGSMAQGSGTSGSSGSAGNSGTTNAGMSSGQSMQTGMSGSGSTSGLADIYRIQIEISELQNSLLLLKDQQNSVLARFNGFLNRPPLTPVTLPDTLIGDTISIDLASLPDSIHANSPILSMLQYEQQSLDTRKEMNRRMGRPMIGVGLNYSVITPAEMSESDMSGRDMVMPMLKMTLPIYRKKYKAMQNEAEALKNASQQAYIAASNDLETQYFEALQLYSEAQRRMQLYKNQSQLAQRSLDIMIRSYSSAANQLTDVLTIRQQLLNYELLEVQAVADYNTSIALLKRLSGMMPVK